MATKVLKRWRLFRSEAVLTASRRKLKRWHTFWQPVLGRALLYVARRRPNVTNFED